MNLVWRERVIFVPEQAEADALVLARLVRFVAGFAGLVLLRGRLVADLELGEHEHHVRQLGRQLRARQQALEPQRQIRDEVDDAVFRAGELVVRQLGRRRARGREPVAARACCATTLRRSTSWLTDSPGTT